MADNRSIYAFQMDEWTNEDGMEELTSEAECWQCHLVGSVHPERNAQRKAVETGENDNDVSPVSYYYYYRR